MDFIVGLTKLDYKSAIKVVFDCISKDAYFCVLSHPFTPSSAGQVFMDQIFKLHGMPISHVVDCNIINLKIT